MTDNHSQSFFGQNTGMILNSPSRSEPHFFIRCIKKKPDGSWEKPSLGEGKTTKFSLDEIVMMLHVLNRKMLNWSSYHAYKDIKTPISFNWEDEKHKTLWINIGDYRKMLNFAQVEIMRLLLTHILDEKIVYATSGKKQINNIKTETSEEEFEKTPEIVETRKIIKEVETETIPAPKKQFAQKTKDSMNIEGSIKGETPKALLIAFSPENEIWVPKSTVHGQYGTQKDVSQEFLIDTWILKRNKIIT